MSAFETEIRDSDRARRLVAQGLVLQRAVKAPSPRLWRDAMQWALQLSAAGEPMPPVGFIADLGGLIFGGYQNLGALPSAAIRDGLSPDADHGADPPADAGADHEAKPPALAFVFEPPRLPASASEMMRRYEDYVLGKLCNDGSFERGGDAIRHYRKSEQVQGLAFLILRFQERAGFRGVRFSPAVLKHLLSLNAVDLLRVGRDSLAADGPLDELSQSYEDLIAHVRNAPEALGIEDVIELERKTAIAGFGQRVGFRQALRLSGALREGIDPRRIRPQGRPRDVSTRIFEEDAYPVGGFSSISTKGTMESLLQSQLAYMEPAAAERPDMFDIKFIRDELLYYARDENQFLRQRKTFVFGLHPNLTHCRHKDKELPYQRIIMILGMLDAAVRSLIDLLSRDALRFELLFLAPKLSDQPMAQEQALAEMLLREQIENGTVVVQAFAMDPDAVSISSSAASAKSSKTSAKRGKSRSVSAASKETASTLKTFEAHCDLIARRSLCHALIIAADEPPLHLNSALPAVLRVDGPIPALGFGRDPAEPADADAAAEAWAAALRTLLEHWI